MTSKIIDYSDLPLNVLSLHEFIEHIAPMGDLTSLYVTDNKGRVFERVSLEEETLSDGSKVYNLVLSDT